MAVLVDRACMTTFTVGTGTITLAAAFPTFQTFAAAGVVNGDVPEYLIEDGSNWEIGTGIYTSVGTTLTRTLRSSSTGALIALSGSAIVTIGPTANTMQSRAPLASPTFTGIVTAPRVTGLATPTISSDATNKAYVDAISNVVTPPVDDNDTSIATTAYVIGQGSTSAPLGAGVPAAGTSLRWARADHMHPLTYIAISSLAPTTLAQGAAWWNSNTGKLYVYTGSEWVVATNDALPVASASTLGAVRIGTGLAIDGVGLVTITSINNIPIGATTRSTGAFTSLNASTTLNVTGAATLSSTLAITGITTLSSSLTVAGATTLSSSLTVAGATTLSSSLTTVGNIYSTGGVVGTNVAGSGDAVLTSGGTANSGYIAWYNPSAVRQGYIGFSPNAGGPINMTAEGTATGYSMIGTAIFLDSNGIPTTNFYTSNGAKIHRIADRLFVGAASVLNDGSSNISTWLGASGGGMNKYMDMTCNMQVLGTPNGVMAAAFAVRTSDNNTYFDSMGITTYGKNDHPTVDKEVWGIYTSAVRVTSHGRYTAGIESDVTTLLPQVVCGSYSCNSNVNPGITTCMTLASGGEIALRTPPTDSGIDVNPTSTAMLIFTAGGSGVNQSDPLNYAKACFRKGIVFACNAIAGTDGNAPLGQWGTAIEMAKGQALVWSCGPLDSDIGAVMRSDCLSPAYQTRMVFESTQFRINSVMSDLVHECPVFAVNSVPNAANWLTIGATILGSNVVYISASSDTTVPGTTGDANIDLYLLPQGSGMVRFGGSSAGSAVNNANFHAFAYIPLKDAGGNVYYIPAMTTPW